jgi:hypothetical protein
MLPFVHHLSLLSQNCWDLRPLRYCLPGQEPEVQIRPSLDHHRLALQNLRRADGIHHRLRGQEDSVVDSHPSYHFVPLVLVRRLGRFALPQLWRRH